MSSNLFSLSLSGVLRRRRESLLVVAILILSFGAGILSLSLLGSMSRTNAEYKLNTYGEWYGAIIDGKEEDAQWLKERDWLDELGTARLFGHVWDGTSVQDNHGRFYGMGTVDEGYKRLARLRLDEGRWPEADGEAAVEAQLLIDLGYEPVVGQTITMRVDSNHFGDSDQITFFVDYTFTVCGVIHDYSQLWEVERNRVMRPLIGAVVTDAAWEQMYESCVAQSVYVWDYTGEWRFEQVPEYFFTVRGGSLDTKQKQELNNYLSSTRLLGAEDIMPSYNTMNDPDQLSKSRPVGSNETQPQESTAVPGGEPAPGATDNGKLPPADSGVQTVVVEDEPSSQPRTEDAYQYLILVVTLFAVLCVYVLQFPRQAHTYAVFRAIGASRWKLAGIILWETLILCVPAALLGTGLGAALTWAALRIWIYAGSAVEIQVYIPMDDLGLFALLWAATTLIARTAVFLFAVRMPLTGRFRLGSGKVRGARRVRYALVLVLGCVAVVTALDAARSAKNISSRIQNFSDIPDYEITGKNNLDLRQVFSRENVELLRSIPGVAHVAPFNSLPVEVSFPGVQDAYATLLAVDESDEYWGFLPFDGEEDRRAFLEGEFVFVLGYAGADSAGWQGWQGEQTVELTAHETGPDQKRLERQLAAWSSTARASDARPSTLVITKGSQYDIFCSHGYLEALLSSMEPDIRWGNLITGSEYGYKNIYLEETSLADDLATEVTLERVMVDMNALFTNIGAMYDAMIQSLQNSMILNVAVGLCVALIALLLMTSVLSLETQQERRRYTLLRVLGLSRRSMRGELVKSALGRSALASAVGWCAFTAYVAYSYLTQRQDLKFVLEQTASELNFGGRYVLTAALALGGLGILFVLIMLSKWELLKGGADDVHDITSAGTV